MNKIKIAYVQFKNLLARSKYLNNWYSLYLVYFKIKKFSKIKFKNSITVNVYANNLSNFFFAEGLYTSKDPKMIELLNSLENEINKEDNFVISFANRLWYINRNYMMDSLYDIFQDKSEPKTFKIFSNIKGKLFVNVGANCGGYACRGDNFEKIVAIEPSKVFSILRKNCELNKIKNIKLLNKAIWSKKGKLKLYETSTRLGISSGLSTLSPESMGTEGISYNKSYSVRVDTLDNILKNEKEVDLLLIDAENAEYEILVGGKNTLKSAKRVIIEVRKNTEYKVRQVLRHEGFKIKALDKFDYSKNIYGFRD